MLLPSFTILNDSTPYTGTVILDVENKDAQSYYNSPTLKPHLTQLLAERTSFFITDNYPNNFIALNKLIE